MYPELESLAVRLVESGMMRIDADAKSNFVRLSLPHEGIHLLFSEKELTVPALLKRTKEKLIVNLRSGRSQKQVEAQADKAILQMQKDLKKNIRVSEEVKLKLARVLTQSVPPVVVMLMLLEEVEVLISYSYTIGDLLDIPTWQAQRWNSGMQSTGGGGCAVFVSCGGDPFAVQEEKNVTYGDGFPALARMMVIAGQEMGHYSDIMRNRAGYPVSRHSADLGGTRAKEHVRIGRLRDLQACTQLMHLCEKLGIRRLHELEKGIQFYRKIKKRRLVLFFKKVRHAIARRFFIRRCLKHQLEFVTTFTVGKLIATNILTAIADMKFNLAPQADAYRRNNPRAQEAIACIEALARVPQQVNKWGHVVTRTMMPNLYEVYYSEVLPACIESYERMSGEKYKMRFKKPSFSWKLFFRRCNPFKKKKQIRMFAIE